MPAPPREPPPPSRASHRPYSPEVSSTPVSRVYNPKTTLPARVHRVNPSVNALESFARLAALRSPSSRARRPPSRANRPHSRRPRAHPSRAFLSLFRARDARDARPPTPPRRSRAGNILPRHRPSPRFAVVVRAVVVASFRALARSRRAPALARSAPSTPSSRRRADRTSSSDASRDAATTTRRRRGGGRRRTKGVRGTWTRFTLYTGFGVILVFYSYACRRGIFCEGGGRGGVFVESRLRRLCRRPRREGTWDGVVG